MEYALKLDPDRIVAKANQPYAVIDIGSNSVRLVVYDELGRAPFPRFNEKSLCRLGAGLTDDGRLDVEAMEMTVRAVCRFSEVARAMGVTHIDVVATDAVRRASNGSKLVAMIADQAKLETRVLTGTEEARFSALGVVSGFYQPRGLVGDFGGGSLEVAEVFHDSVSSDRLVSLPLGALPVQAMLSASPRDAKQQVDETLRAALPPMLTEPVFYAIGGGWRALAHIHMVSNQNPVQVTHGYEMPADEARSFAKSVSRLVDEQVSALAGVPRRRVPTLPAAALVFDRVLKHLKPERVVFSSLGLREGWLYAQLPREEQARDPLVEGAQIFATTQARVHDFARALTRWTDDLFPGEVPAERRLRIAACALSDIGWRDHGDVQAVESFRRLLHFPFIGLDHSERVFIAAVVHARYAGKADDPNVAPALGVLSEAQRRRAQILGRAMLLGYRFAASVPEILDSAHLKVEADRVTLQVSRSEHSIPDSDAVRARLRLFAKALGAAHTKIARVA